MSEAEANHKIDLVKEIVKGGVAVILACGLIAFLCFQSYIQYHQLDTLRANSERQTIALEMISRTYTGKQF
jgi:hypothetical protein